VGTPFISEIKIISWNFPPKGWAFCNNQQLPINQNQALFSLIGTNFGGNGQTTFALPDLRGRAPIHVGPGFNAIGQAGGETAHTLTQSEMPEHVHLMNASSTDGNTNTPTGNLLAREVGNVYRPASAGLAAMNPAIVSNTGGSQAHNNMQPYLVLNYVIALIGVFPSRN
jgi:microcystin-dependent protein